METANTFVQCPYDKSHQMTKLRLAKHLISCRRNHRNVKKVYCPFNSTHVVNEPELDFHVQCCENRQDFENFKKLPEPAIGSSLNKPTVSLPIECSENWDDDDTPSYNPQQYVSNAPILRNIQGQSKSIRKRFREEERLRHMEFQTCQKLRENHN